MPRSRERGAARFCLIASPPGAAVGELGAVLERAGFLTRRVSTEPEAHEALEGTTPTAVFVSQALGLTAIASLVARAAVRPAPAPVIVLAATGTVQEAVDAMQQGAADYLPAPLQPEAAVPRLLKVLARRARPAAGSAAPPSGLIGTSLAMRKIDTTIERISRYKANVLLLGESGTGKELIARSLHARGPHRHHLFVPLNCASLGRDILENELFGHERGAFTGANERKQGLLELADGGTVFLDEIGEMDVATQAKLLRVLERNEFRRVGGTQKLKVDISVIAATNRDLEQDVEAGRFREDLYYRLKVVTLVVPPLRDRREDIPDLVRAFIDDFNRRNGGRIRSVSREAIRLLGAHDWPGNVRQLKNTIESAAVLTTSEVIDAGSIAEQLTGRPSHRPEMRRALPPAAGSRARSVATEGVLTIPLGTTLADAERDLILATLNHARTRAAAARALGLGLRTLYTKLRQYGLSEAGTPISAKSAP